MNDDAVRAILLSLHQRILTIQHVNADLLGSLCRSHLAIFESQDAIRRSDRLIESLSKSWIN